VLHIIFDDSVFGFSLGHRLPGWHQSSRLFLCLLPGAGTYRKR